MLKSRILTASILLPFWLWLIFITTSNIFLIITGVIIIAAAIEWLKLLNTSVTIKKILFIVCLTITYILGNNINYIIINIKLIMQACSVLWVLFLGLICFITKKSRREYQQTANSNLIFLLPNLYNNLLIFGYFFYAILPSWFAINYLKITNQSLLLLASMVIIFTDLGGYSLGKKFGKHQLTIISPKKTWEGLLGGYLGSLLIGLILYWNFNFNNTISVLLLITLITITSIFAVIGDLLESLLKRIIGVKNTSNILPGHGGILDRIDSFCSGIPIFLLGVLYFA